VRALFEAALPLDASGREALLADPALTPAQVAEVRSLLHFVDETRAGVLGQGAAALATPLPDEAPTERVGQRLGAWRVVELLGRGGMGEVWLAERADGAYAGQAAIKVVRAGRSSASVLARFAVEQQALARLSHPHITHLLDAGRTADGQPYFVMERVSGQPIDKACEGRPLPERLGLFLQLTDAVAHAHRQLLVHRDLKPSNVLVTESGEVKLLDFGIAKALDATAPVPDAGSLELESTDDESALTRAGERPFSPRYASPEQVRGEAVGTATDVYSLGVLLYVMLTGVSPYGRSASTPADAARSVLDETPTRPSRLPPDLVGPDWEAMRQRLRGDLDSILLKALAKQPDARYASVDALAADLRAYLDKRPVSAGPGTWAYVTSRFVQRNAFVVGLASLAFLGLVGGLAGTAWQAHEARLARDAAQRHLADVRKLANSMVLEVNESLRQGVTEAQRILAKTAAEYFLRQQGIADQTDAERIDLARALNSLARLEGHASNHNVGDFAAAQEHYKQALALLEPLESRQSQNSDWQGTMVASLEGLSSVLREQRELPEAMALMQRTATHARRAAALKPESLRLRSFVCAALIQSSSLAYSVDDDLSTNELDKALEAAQQTLSCTQQLVLDFPQQPRAWKVRAIGLHVQAGLDAIRGRFHESLSGEQAAQEAAERSFALPNGEQERFWIESGRHYYLGDAHRHLGNMAEAEAFYRRGLARTETFLQGDPRNQMHRLDYTSLLHAALSMALRTGHTADALMLYERLLGVLAKAGVAVETDEARVERIRVEADVVIVQALLGRRREAVQGAAALAALIERGSVSFDLRHRAGDAEQLALVQAARAAAALLEGNRPAGIRFAEDAVESLATMRRLRAQGDAVAIMQSADILALLGRLPWGGDAAASAQRQRLQQAARDLLETLERPGEVTMEASPEARGPAHPQ
jgi:tetratricopeptide (TPR) repeat protein